MIVTGAENIESLRQMVLIRALALEINTGMRRSNLGASTLKLLQEAGLTDKKQKKPAMRQIVANMEAQGMEISSSLRSAVK